MNKECVRVQDEIWESAREKTGLRESVLAHVSQCRECERLRAEADLSFRLLRCAASHPDAPDCRAVVSARIAEADRTSWPRRLAWTAFPAVVVVAGLLALPTGLNHRPETPDKNRIASVSQNQPPAVPPASSPVAQQVSPNLTEPTRPERAAPKTVRATPPKQPTIKTERVAAKLSVLSRAGRDPLTLGDTWSYATTDETPLGLYADAESAGVSRGIPAEESAGTVIAAVSVEWSARPSTEDLSYSFTEEDDAAGTVTSGSVARSGNSIEIRIESEPVAPESPTRGEITIDEVPTA